MAHKLITVIGGTGSQGSGLVQAILDDPDGEFRARVVTRNPDSGRARALVAAGAEVVQADLDDVESLGAAFDGAHGAFCVTNYWEHMSPDREMAQARRTSRPRPRTAGVQPRDLVYPRGHQTLDPSRGRPHADAHGAVQGAPLRREG